MKCTYPHYYKNFRCIADKCPDTCCAGWEIVVDAESAEKYRLADGEIGKKLRQAMTVDSDGDTVFVSRNRRCPFLLGNNLCEIYIELGEKSLCRTCTLFPRHITDLGSRREIGISVSCPEAARLIFSSDEPITFETVDEDVPIQPNDIDPTSYFILQKAQKTAINILQNRKFSLNLRLIAFLRFCEGVQKQIRSGNVAEIPMNDEYFLPVLPSYSQAKRTLNRHSDLLISLEKLNSEWTHELKNAKKLRAEDILYPDEAEHLAVCLAFRYFMTAAFDGNLISKARFTVFSVISSLILASASPRFGNKDERIEAYRRYSKEVEHSAENLDCIFTAIKKSRYFGSDNLINILSSKEK